ncbi:hypothetical protein [Candidatus Lokiarchaeum ossiferum]|uniref:hypothetical protein n=1 Tax=Candidatus Lokiarchaeum ossiferum TaxID=2951803 RepID=UPI00352F7356
MRKNLKISLIPHVFLSNLLNKLEEIEIDFSYTESYKHFIDYFKNPDVIEEKHFYISTNFVYGWMPTILKYKSNKINDCISLLNEVKSGEILNKDQLTILKSTINNSIIGVSKLLHFINPDNYAMWDSNICNFLYGSKDIANNIDRYLEYTSFIDKIVNSDEFIASFPKYQEKFNDFTSGKIRVLENMMFQVGKKA